ncbi:MAG: S1 RNA-binding domain-containing protein [Lachnospiraceae bacterium]|nr:S1 RNA-binding domain-containing protein [Lachnospiraceae bacterium]
MESMSDYKEELERSYESIEKGDLVNGIIVAVRDTEAVIDAGRLEHAILPANEVSADPKSGLRDLKEGEEYTFLVIDSEDERGRTVVSKKRAEELLSWNELEELFNAGEDLTVRISEAVKGGVTAYIKGIRAFIPASQLSTGFVKDLTEWVNKDVTARIITFERDKKRLVLSSRVVEEEKAAREKEALMDSVKEGAVLSGKVDSIRPFGAFIKLDNGLSGLVHISQISFKHLKTPDEVLKEGEPVTVKVIGIKDGKISLSIKALQDVEKTVTDDAPGLREYRDKGSISRNLGDLLKDFKLKQD